MIPILRVRLSGYSRVGAPPPPLTARNCGLCCCCRAATSGISLLYGPAGGDDAPATTPRATGSSSPSVVSEGLVGLGHLVHVLTALCGAAGAAGGVQDLARKAVGHAPLPSASREGHQPANGKRGAAARRNLNRHLIGRAAHSAGAHLQ